MTHKKNEQKSTAFQMVEIDHKKFAVELQKEHLNVNLTQMARKFGRKVSHWLELEESKSYINLLAMSLKTASADLLEVRKGGIPGNQGTWAKDRRIAMRFAQWLDPSFAIQVDEMLVKLITGQAVYTEPFKGVYPLLIDGKPYYNYLDVLAAVGYSHTSGMVAIRKREFPQEFIKVYGRNFITLKFANFLASRYKYRQLVLDFYKEERSA
jgi:hypothetical protein